MVYVQKIYRLENRRKRMHNQEKNEYPHPPLDSIQKKKTWKNKIHKENEQKYRNYL